MTSLYAYPVPTKLVHQARLLGLRVFTVTRNGVSVDGVIELVRLALTLGLWCAEMSIGMDRKSRSHIL